MNILRFIMAAFITVTFLSSLSHAQQNVTEASMEGNNVPFSLTISGGISLGSYEAGVNWALIEYMRKIREGGKETPDLKVITGASAGSINAILTAMAWLTRPSENLNIMREISELKRINFPENNQENDPEQALFPVELNVLRDSWVSVGIDELLPEDESEYTNPPRNTAEEISTYSRAERKNRQLVDSLFTRKAFDLPVALIRKMLDLKVYIPEESVPLALLATREKPIEISEGGVKVKNQRFVFRLEFKTDSEGKGRFITRRTNCDPNLGTVVYLPGKEGKDGTIEVSNDDVIRLMYASSAFPIAFGKVKLQYCTEHEGGKKTSEIKQRIPEFLSCPEGTFLTSADFIDGGVFDNVPLGAARAIVKEAEAEQKKGNASAEAVDNTLKKSDMTNKNMYFFISPSTRRHVYDPMKNPLMREPRTFGLGGILAFVPGFVDTASDYELYTALRKGDWIAYDVNPKALPSASCAPTEKNCPNPPSENSKAKLIVTDRYFPITGAFLGHFGAFLDQPFREFDYYAGVYDTVNVLAKYVCHKKEKDQEESCLGKEAMEIYKKLGIHDSKAARTVFTLIATQEHKDYRNKVEYVNNDNKEIKSPAWRWIIDELPNSFERPESMQLIFDSMVETSKTPISDDDDEETLSKFVAQLKAKGYADRDEARHSSMMKRIIERSDEKRTSWYAPMVGRAGKRLQQLQKFESEANDGSSMGFLAAAAALGLAKNFSYDETLTIGPSSQPGNYGWGQLNWYNIIPYEFSTDTMNGGFALSYLPRFRIKDFSVDLKATPVADNKFGHDRVFFSQGDLYLSWHKIPFITSGGIGPTYNFLWQPAEGYDRTNLGIAGYFELFKTLRFTVGVRSVEAHRFFANNTYITLGIVDLPGLASRLMSW